MARLVEVRAQQVSGRGLSVEAGDLLLFRASGGSVESGPDVVERLGPFTSAVVGDDGRVIAPMGAPDTVLFLARRPGEAVIRVVGGDPWHAPRPGTLRVSVREPEPRREP